MTFRLRGENTYVSHGGKWTLPGTTISGVRNSPRFIGYAENTLTLVVLFKEGGAAAFFREPIHRLFSETVGLDELINSLEVKKVKDQLSGAKNDKTRISIIERFLMNRMYKTETDRLVSAAVQQINQVSGFVRIKELGDRLCISKDAFEKRFRRTVGTSPKQFASLVRMSSIIKQTCGRDELIGTAIDAGFFDESHFIKAFKQFTGQTPTDFSKSGPYW
ncbi:MAG: helix-turn-helix transcriptional regulator [Bacteroidota bacterium]|nr:helix-turn-helix transcriptional regulator [Bacteroidota bacterium]